MYHLILSHNPASILMDLLETNEYTLIVRSIWFVDCLTNLFKLKIILCMSFFNQMIFELFNYLHVT